jgi:hypothetical protein
VNFVVAALSIADLGELFRFNIAGSHNIDNDEGLPKSKEGQQRPEIDVRARDITHQVWLQGKHESKYQVTRNTDPSSISLLSLEEAIDRHMEGIAGIYAGHIPVSLVSRLTSSTTTYGKQHVDVATGSNRGRELKPIVWGSAP